MRKIISLIIIGMLTIGMVGCGKDYVLQEQIDIFKTINNQEINTNSMEDYYNSFDIEGLEIKYYPSVKQMWFKVELNEGDFGLANVAPTVAKLFGLEAPATWEKSIIK